MKKVLVLATCCMAWVMWSKTTPLQGASTVKWEMEDTFGAPRGERECKSIAQRREASERLNIAWEVKFVCVPDTVDPRPRS